MIFGGFYKMPTCIVVEGRKDMQLLTKILSPELQEGHSLKIFDAGSQSATVSLPRTLLRDKNNNVVVFTDADSTNPAPRRTFVENMLKEISPSEENRWHLFVMVPEFEALFFENPVIFKEVFGQELDETSLIKGKYEPKRILSELIKTKDDSWSEFDILSLRGTGTMQELIQIIHALQDQERSSLLSIAA